MPAGDGEAAVRDWARRTLGSDDVVRVPHLSTPHYDFYAVSQPRVGHAGDVYVMTDGDQVLPAGRENFAEVLRREGVLDDPAAIPATQLAELGIRMAEVRPVRVLEDASDFALEEVESDVRAEFAPPEVRGVEDGVEAAFWTAGPEPSRVERWRLRVTRDGAVTPEVERVS